MTPRRAASWLGGLALILALGCKSKPADPPVDAHPIEDAPPVPPGNSTAVPVDDGPEPIAGQGGSAPVPGDAAPATATARANDFTAHAFAAAAAANKGNVFLSPASARVALSMVYVGAAGDTATEMAKALSLQTGDATSPKLAATAAGSPVELKLANRLFGEKTFPFDAGYTGQLKKDFGAGLDPVDFKTNPESGRAVVNAWVKRETADKIKELLPSGSVSQLTRLVVANAIYFKGDWDTTFDKKLTANADFTVDGGAKKSVPMMRRTEQFSYAEVGLKTGGKLKLARIPYKGKTMAMVVALPEGATVDAAAAALTFSTLESAHKQFDSSRRLDLWMPRFEMSWGGSISALLQGLGMKKAFTQNAELPKIGKELMISDVFHKAYVKVDEKGTEAAAATGVVINVKSAPLPPDPFHLDKPFIFYIEDTATGDVLFIGRVSDPAGGG